MNKQQLASTIWESANQMRSKIEANEYKDFILGFIFYKYLSEKELTLLRQEKFSEEEIKKIDENDIKLAGHIKETLGYFISYDNLFSTWLDKGNDFDVSNVRDALSAFDRNIDDVYTKVFEKIFNTLQTGLSKLGETSVAQTKSIKKLLRLIKKIPMDGKQDYDVLGFIYEYLISNFAANAGKKAGEFYTPHEVSVLMSEIVAEHLKNKKQIRIYDPTSGSGSLLINIGKSASRYLDGDDKIDYYAQELKENTYNLTRMNLVMRGIKPANINVRNADTLEEDWPFIEDTKRDNKQCLVKVDAVVSNPPYSQKWDPTDKGFDPRYKNYGVAPKAKADYAFLLHDLYHIEDDGIMTIVLPHGVLFRGGEEGKIRENLIEKNNIDTIIGLPENIFFGTNIATIIMILKRERPTSDVLIIDASKGFEKSGKNNKLRECDIKKIVDTVINRKSIEKYSTLVTKNEIKANEYNLNIPRYVDTSELPEKWDIRATMFGGIPKTELKTYEKYWVAFPGLRETLFEEISDEYVKPANSDIKEIIANHESVKSYKSNFKEAFHGFYEFLYEDLIDGILDVDVKQEMNIITDDIFRRIDSIKLADKYTAYQVFVGYWNIISTDIEMLQTEGFEVITQVDPNMVIKKNKDEADVTEIQDGWKGHILPFDLVQHELMPDEVGEVENIGNRLSEITETYNEIIESMDEDEREGKYLNEAKDAFILDELKITADEIIQDIDNNEIKALQKYLLLTKKKERLEYIQSVHNVEWAVIDKSNDGTCKKDAVNKRIQELVSMHSFLEESFEYKIMTALNLMVEENRLKKELKLKKEELHLRTKTVIEGLSEEQALIILEHKWIRPLVNSLSSISNNILKEMTDKIVYISGKYSTTLHDIKNEKTEVSNNLCNMIATLKAGKSDTEGFQEFQKILWGMS
jgi:type I restriction enzyme M protein